MPTKLESNKKCAVKDDADVNLQNPEEVVRAWQEEDRENLDILEFIQAIDKYKRRTQKSFPAWSEVLSILKDLGYRKVQD